MHCNTFAGGLMTAKQVILVNITHVIIYKIKKIHVLEYGIELAETINITYYNIIYCYRFEILHHRYYLSGNRIGKASIVNLRKKIVNN
jgi:hypothetical protein